MSSHKRRKKLIQPRLQLRLILAFFGVATLALILQFILFATSLSNLASELPSEGPLLLERIPSHTLWVLAVSFLVLMPLTFGVGVIVTFRVAGPLYRFDQHLKAIARGEDPGECRIRKDDELQDLCATLNAAIGVLRKADPLRAESASSGEERKAA